MSFEILIWVSLFLTTTNNRSVVIFGLSQIKNVCIILVSTFILYNSFKNNTNDILSERVYLVVVYQILE